MGELTADQKQRIRKLVKKELTSEQATELKNSFTEDQASQVRSEVWKTTFGVRPETLGPALLLIGVFALMLWGLLAGLN